MTALQEARKLQNSNGRKSVNNLTGRRFGRLVAKEYRLREGQAPDWLCVCDCGNEKWISRTSLIKGVTTSCGCYKMKLSESSAVEVLMVLKVLADGEIHHNIFADDKVRANRLGKTMRGLELYTIPERGQYQITERGSYVLERCPSLEPEQARVDLARALGSQRFCAHCHKPMMDFGSAKYHPGACKREAQRSRDRARMRGIHSGEIKVKNPRNTERCYAFMILFDNLPYESVDCLSTSSRKRKHLEACGILENGNVIYRGLLT